jgi:hypothetical protein
MEKEMTPAWVVENYLPDFDKRYLEWSINYCGKSQPNNLCTHSVFIFENFSEALAAYRDTIWREAFEAMNDEYCEQWFIMIEDYDDFPIGSMYLGEPDVDPKDCRKATSEEIIRYFKNKRS